MTNNNTKHLFLSIIFDMKVHVNAWICASHHTQLLVMLVEVFLFSFYVYPNKNSKTYKDIYMIDLKQLI